MQEILRSVLLSLHHSLQQSTPFHPPAGGIPWENNPELCFISRSDPVWSPSTKYIVSSLTFPTYFLKDGNEVNEEHAKIDALIFKEYFMKKLFIKKRYLGEESNPKMINYNNTLKEILKDKVVIIPRLCEDSQAVSASRVRSLIEQNKVDEALAYIPKENALIFRSIVRAKYGY